MMAELGNFNFVREVEVETVSKTIKINQYYISDVGCIVWDSALALGKYLDFSRSKRDTICGKSVIELGSGTGFVGIIAAVLGANVTLTDLAENMSILAENMEINKHLIDSRISASPLKWGGHHDFCPVDIIIVSDCVYYKESVEDLVHTIFSLCKVNTEVLISYEDRGYHQHLMDAFLNALSKRLEIVHLPQSECHPDYVSPDIHILSCQALDKEFENLSISVKHV